MVFLVGSVLLQILCIVHVIKTGRNQMWIMAIGFLSLIGCAAYLIVEVLPGLGGNRHVRTARAQIVAKVDPERNLRSAHDALSLADTAANRIDVADAYADLGRHFDALPHYRLALGMIAGTDPRTQFKLARSLFETGDSVAALVIIDAQPAVTSTSENDRRALLRAQVLSDLGRNDEAVAIYEDIVTRIAGEEARCRYAALLLQMRQPDRARHILEEVEARAKRLDRTQRAAEIEMYDWAAVTLRDLRAKG